MKKSIYTTTEEITKGFIENGWSKNTSFSELTLNEAEEKGYLFAIRGMNKGHKYFKMNNTENIYDDKGTLVMYNLSCKSNL